MSESKHTPGPFRSSTEGTHHYEVTSSTTGDLVAYCYNQADTEFIVQACNAHDDLLAALECVVAALGQNATYPADVDLAHQAAVEAIAKAKGES